ncbi:MAG: hypothetical protein IKB64_05865, partial [Paludibacteraceae bacterium]|nr:hypothetical protein [Paludibacteraceae bacterium]
MKNFTNNFKQFTSRLSARWLIMALMLLMGTSSAWAANFNGTIYFEKPDNWGNTIYFCIGHGSHSQMNHKMSVQCGKIYKIELSNWNNATAIGFTDQNLSSWENNNENIETRFGYVSGNKVLIKSNLAVNRVYNSSGGYVNYSSSLCCTPVDITWNDFTDNMCVGDAQALTATASHGTVTYSSNNSNATISGTTLTATKAGSATITASVAASGSYCSATANKTVTISNCIPVGTILYLEPSSSQWASANARYALYLFKDGGSSTWVDAEEVCNNDGYYQAIVPEGVYEEMIWVRMNPATTANNWDNKWNQTGDLTYDSRYDLFTVSNTNDWNGATTTWSKWTTKQPCCTDPTITLSNNEVTYNGSAQKPTFNGVTPTKVTYDDIELANGPTDAGTYTVKIWADASGDFCEVVGVELTDKFVIKGKAPVASDFTYTNSKNYTGSALSADVAWNTNLAAGVGGAITTYYKVKNAADNTYTTTVPTNVGTYTVAVTTLAGGNYAAATTKIVLGDFTINGKAPVASDFTYTNSKNYTGSALSADVVWESGTGIGAITTYYKVKGAADNTYTTTVPTNVGTYTVAVTTLAGGNYAAATTKIVLGDFTIN